MDLVILPGVVLAVFGFVFTGLYGLLGPSPRKYLALMNSVLYAGAAVLLFAQGLITQQPDHDNIVVILVLVSALALAATIALLFVRRKTS